MHNQRKVKTTADKMRERLEASKLKAKEYVALREQFLKYQEEENYSIEALHLTSRMLSMSADCYTVWNYRKKILMSLDEKFPETKVERDKDEMKWLESMVFNHHKSYWIWFHRKWLSLRTQNMDWDRELQICTAALDIDQRNFHCWNHRRFVAEKAKASLKDELNFTMKKIEQNFSNYSSWHHRSYTLGKVFESDPTQIVKLLNEELDLVQNAFYTSPEDQSAWFYHRWLIGMHKKHNPENVKEIVAEELQKVKELVEQEPNSKWARLTCVFLQKELGDHSYNDELLKLAEFDPKRKNYYHDLLSNKEQK